MHRMIVILAAAAILLSGACASKPETRRKAQGAEGNKHSAGQETRTRYRELEGSPDYSSDEAEDQLEGD